jgi:hypothetical protein
MAKTVITGAAGASTASNAAVTDPNGVYAPVVTGRRKDDGHGG